MTRHPYIRAYMAGIFLPTILILIAMVAFTFFRYVFDVPVPVERVIVFPLAIIPNAWGLWNVIHLRLAPRMPLGLFGAILPFLLVPGGYVLTRLVHFDIPTILLHIAPYAFPISLAIYYLLWKHVVGSLNAIVGLP